MLHRIMIAGHFPAVNAAPVQGQCNINTSKGLDKRGEYAYHAIKCIVPGDWDRGVDTSVPRRSPRGARIPWERGTTETGRRRRRKVGERENMPPTVTALLWSAICEVAF